MAETRKRKGPARDAGLERRWRRLLAQQARSGLTARAYCQRKRIPETSFYCWRREVLRRDQERSDQRAGTTIRDRIAPMAVGQKPAAVSFSEVEVKRDEHTPTCRGSVIELLLPSAVVVRVGRDVDEESLRRVLAVVEARRC
jgi:hypothetical protein